jgi:eukaryotic-like serine/threonine-protein kinase
MRVSAHWSAIHALKIYIMIVWLMMNRISYETKGRWQKMHFEGKQIGRYRFERLIGRGAMGEVYLAVDPRILQQVAVKVLQAEPSVYPATNVAREAERFRREASAIANLRHPHIVPLYDYDETSIDETAITYLVIPYYKEGSFTSWLRRRGSDLLPMEDVVYFVQQAADALQYAHDQQVIHRDVKPSNFLIDTSENSNRPNLLLADFGISKFAMGTTAGGTQSLGTLTYMPPEQLYGRPTYASDQYALAIMAYELLVGHPPFEGPAPVLIRQHMEDQPQPPSMLNPGLPRAIDHVLLRALDKKPENRYPTISEFARALQQALPGTSDSPMGRIEQGKETIPSDTSASSSEETLTHPSPAEEKQTTVAAANPQAISAPETSSFHSSPTQAAAMPPTARPLLPTRGSRLNRRTLLFLGIALLILLGGVVGGVAFLFVSRSSAGNYPMFGFDPAHTHFNTQEHTLTPANVSQLEQRWVMPVGEAIWSSPAVADGSVYISTVSPDSKLYSFDAVTGNRLWVFSDAHESLISSPAVVNGIIYIGSLDHNLYAINATTGRKLWSAQTTDAIYSSPTVVDRTVYVASRDGFLYALPAAGCGDTTCMPLWKAPIGMGADYSSPAVANGKVYIVTQDDALYVVDSQTERSRALVPPKQRHSGQGSSPSVADGVVYLGSEDQNLYAYDADTGKQLWAGPTGASIDSAPAIANGVVYVGSSNGLLYAFNASGCGGKATCQPLWVGATGAAIGSAPTVANGVVYVGSTDHKVYAFDASGCQRQQCVSLWSRSTGDAVSSSPAVVNGMVYIGSIDQKLYAFALKG